MNLYASILLLLIVSITGCSANSIADATFHKTTKLNPPLSKSTWDHGSPDCEQNRQPALDVYKHDEQTFIIRQNKCLTFEAPFIYILAGDSKTLILDTGALSDSPTFSFRTEIEKVIGKTLFEKNELIIIHSHGHSDHYQGDASFSHLSNVRLVEPTQKSVHNYFEFHNWPDGQKTIDLGNRKLTILPTPGHQEEALTLYDAKTKWLMTGDTLYPGYIYIKDWNSYRNSINKLVDFTTKNQVTAILGAHIEMKKQPDLYYPIGSTYQPNESHLDLTVQSLQHLNKKLIATENPTEIRFNEFIIKPMGDFQKAMSTLVRWISQ